MPEDRWWWSEDLYRIHGFEPGQIVPTTDVLLAHKHPDDLEQVREVIRGALAGPGAFANYHRILDARKRQRHVLVVGESVAGHDGAVERVRGFFVDLTSVRRDDLADEVTAAVEGVTRHRAAIEQAKGAVMFAYGVDEDEAFTLLCDLSSSSNTKLHVVAERLVGLIGRGDPVVTGARELLSSLLDRCVGGEAYGHLGDTA